MDSLRDDEEREINHHGQAISPDHDDDDDDNDKLFQKSDKVKNFQECSS